MKCISCEVDICIITQGIKAAKKDDPLELLSQKIICLLRITILLAQIQITFNIL